MRSYKNLKTLSYIISLFHKVRNKIQGAPTLTSVKILMITEGKRSIHNYTYWYRNNRIMPNLLICHSVAFTCTCSCHQLKTSIRYIHSQVKCPLRVRLDLYLSGEIKRCSEQKFKIVQFNDKCDV
jgi:hypothetical protein